MMVPVGGQIGKSGFDTKEKTKDDSKRELTKGFIMYVSPDENESYSVELCLIIDNSENECTNTEFVNLTYDLNDTYETMIKFEKLREIYSLICTMTIYVCVDPKIT